VTPAPKSQLTLFAEALEATTALHGEATVLVGKNHLAAAGGPRRIVLIPHTGKYDGPKMKPAIVDVDLDLVARCWAESFDDAEFLHTLFFRALKENADAGGLFWNYDAVAWDTDPDTGQQGQSFEVKLSVRLAVQPAAGRRATVAAHAIAEET